MNRLSPLLLIASAGTLVGLGVKGTFPEESPDDVLDADDASREVDRRSADVRLIQECGFWSHYDHRSRRSSWPLPRGMTTQELAVFGRTRGILHDEPEAGDIFLQYAPQRKAYLHAGIVLGLLGSGRFTPTTPYYDVYTIEGDTDKYGRLGGGKTRRIRRRLLTALGDCFLRWADLDLYDETLGRSISCAAADARRSA